MAKDIMAEIMEAIGQDPNNAQALEEAKRKAQPKGAPAIPQQFNMNSMGAIPMQHGMQSAPSNIPQSIRQFLGPQVTINDSGCGEPVAWGYPVNGRMGEELWEQAKQYGTMLYDHGAWYLVTKQLTREEAMQKYGPVTNEEIGPRGGWRNTTFGTQLFKNKIMAPPKDSK